MNNQKLNAKYLALTLLYYLFLTIVMSIALTSLWQSGLDVSLYDHQQLNGMAAKSQFILVGSAAIGCFAAIVCGHFVTKRTANQGYKHATFIGIGLILYGMLSIVLHPEHSLLHQAAKILAPLPLCWFGAWLSLSKTDNKVLNHVA